AVLEPDDLVFGHAFEVDHFQMRAPARRDRDAGVPLEPALRQERRVAVLPSGLAEQLMERRVAREVGAVALDRNAGENIPTPSVGGAFETMMAGRARHRLTPEHDRSGEVVACVIPAIAPIDEESAPALLMSEDERARSTR